MQFWGDFAQCRSLGLAVLVAGRAAQSAQSAALLWGEALGAETTVPWQCCSAKAMGALQSGDNCVCRARNEASSAGEEWLGSWPVLIIELLQQEHALRLCSSTAFQFLIATPCEVS